MADKELNFGTNIEFKEVEEDSVTRSENSKALKFKPVTDKEVREKYQKWREENRTSKEIKKDIEKSVAFSNIAPNEEIQEEVNKHILFLTSEYIFSKTGIAESALLIGNRAIKLNEVMKENVDLNAKAIISLLDKEAKDDNLKQAMPVEESEQEAFMDNMNQVETTEVPIPEATEVPIPEATEAYIPEEPVVEENIPEINEYEDEPVEKYPAIEVPKEPEVEENIPKVSEYTESAEEYETPEVQPEGPEAEEEYETSNVQEENEEQEDISQDLPAAIPDEPSDEVSEEQEYDTEAQESVVKMDVSVYEDKLRIFNEKMERLAEETRKQDNYSSLITTAQEENKAKLSEKEAKEQELASKNAEIDEIIDSYTREIEEVEQKNAAAEQTYSSLVEENDKLGEEIKELDSKNASVSDLLDKAKKRSF